MLLMKSVCFVRRKYMATRKRQWTIQRHFTQIPQGQQRWDRAFQLILSWTLPPLAASCEEEATHESCSLCTCFNAPASFSTYHRATTGPVTGVLSEPEVAVGRTTCVSRVICYSGAILKRPGLHRLRDQIASAGFDRLLITAPDRLARKYVHQVLLLEEFEQAG
jgi:resolvase-like protein